MIDQARQHLTNASCAFGEVSTLLELLKANPDDIKKVNSYSLARLFERPMDEGYQELDALERAMWKIKEAVKALQP